MKTILLLTHSKDYFTIDRVAEALAKKNIRTFRFNSDLFPEKISLSHRVDASEAKVMIRTAETEIDTSEIDAVWYRKIWSPIIETKMEEKYLQASINESLAVRNSFFQSLGPLPWLDPIPKVQQASDKYYQLRMARQAGLRIPKSIFSNSPKEVLAFFESLDGEMIAKMHTSLSFGMEKSAFSFYTTKISGEDLEDLDLLQICPMIFQEYIPNAFELRVAYVAGQCFTGKIQAKDLTDWRKADPQKVFWTPFTFPEEQQQLLHKLMTKLELSFGAVDYIVKPDGQYIFLEVNPVGEWGMLEKDLELPISQAIANTLIQKIS